MALFPYKRPRGNRNIKQSKYLVAPKVAAKGCTWDLLEWPLFLKQLPKTSTINKMTFLSVEFTQWPSNSCTSLLDTAVYGISPALSTSMRCLNNTQGKQLDRNAVRSKLQSWSLLECKIQNGIKFAKTFRQLRIQRNLRRDIYLSRLVKLPKFPVNHLDNLVNLSSSSGPHLYYRHAIGPSTQHDRQQ